MFIEAPHMALRNDSRMVRKEWGYRVFCWKKKKPKHIVQHQNVTVSDKKQTLQVKDFTAFVYVGRCKNLCCSVTKSYPTLCDPVNYSIPCFPVSLSPEVCWNSSTEVIDAIQPSHPLLPPSPLALNHSQHQGVFQWVDSLHQLAKVLEIQLQPQSFQWILKDGFPLDCLFHFLDVQGTFKSLL